MSVGNSDWVTIALLRKTRGNRGEITALPLSSKPERYQNLTEVWLFGTGERYEVGETWFHDGILIFHFRGVDNIGAAESLVGCEVRVPAAERVPLEEGEFFHDDLIGCQVIDRTTGASLGSVSAFDDSGGAGNLVVGDNLLIPFARAICVEIDPAERRIAVELPEGLKELNRP
ncbi:MAG TPA: ribosome maturation factor RimM [Candidatus Acidoferrales bacterium]|nr:ribosome maturation factor RimM [Candidatus Acidoferrales bacterium]